LGSPSPTVLEENLWKLMKLGFYMGWMFFLPPSHQYQNTERESMRPGLMFSLSTTGLLAEGRCCIYTGFPTPVPNKGIFLDNF